MIFCVVLNLGKTLIVIANWAPATTYTNDGAVLAKHQSRYGTHFSIQWVATNDIGWGHPCQRDATKKP